MNSNKFRQFSETARLAVKHDDPVGSFVSALLCGRFPLAVSGFIVAVVFDTPDGSAFWTFAHVSEEVLEDKPAGADAYSASAVPEKFLVVFVSATAQHGCPSGIDSRVLASRVAVLVGTHGHYFSLQASTRHGSSASQFWAVNNSFVSARAQTAIPRLSALARSSEFSNGVASEDLSNEVVALAFQASTGHLFSVGQISTSHDGFLPTRTAATPASLSTGIGTGEFKSGQSTKNTAGKFSTMGHFVTLQNESDSPGFKIRKPQVNAACRVYSPIRIDSNYTTAV